MVATVTLYVRDLDRTGAFYAGCFDLQPLELSASYVVLSSEQMELTLVAVPEDVAEHITLTDPPTRREQVPVKLGWVVESIAAARSEIERLGGVVDEPSKEWEFRGTLRCDAMDAEGNVIQLIQVHLAGDRGPPRSAAR